MDIKVSDWLQAAQHEVEMRRWRDQSRGKYRELTVECTFKDVAPEVIRWYYANFDVETYRMWHPAHIGLQWENKVAGPGAIHIAWEMIDGKMAAYRIRVDTPGDAPAGLSVPEDAMLLSILDTEGEPLFHIVTRYLPVEGGTVKRSRFVVPQATPESFCEAHRQHWLEEQPGMAYKAAPHLIRKTFGHMVEAHVLRENPLIVPPPMD